MNTKCKWMGIELSTPCIMASLTLMSNTNLNKQIDYYLKALEYGAGAIILPSTNPQPNVQKSNSIVSCLPINTGISKNSNMAFSVLGKTTNLPSLEYSIKLANTLTKKSNGQPIIASISNLGTEKDILTAIEQLSQTDIKGIELNFSCPNIIIQNDSKTSPPIQFLRNARRKTHLPLSLKLTPYENHNQLLSEINGEIDSVTLSNAYLGLIPPDTNTKNFSPFKDFETWSPSGIYGPFEKLLTYYKLYSAENLINDKKLEIACVGGLINSTDILQAILLGADVVQISSGIAWNGIQCFSQINKELCAYLNENNIKSITEIKGQALSSIVNNVDVATKIQSHKMEVNTNLCKKCIPCKCCEKLCIAISQDVNYNVLIDEELCSGCGWCSFNCPNNAITITTNNKQKYKN